MSAIRCEHVGKVYDLTAGRRTLFSSLKFATGGRVEDGIFYALSDVSFNVERGEAVGIIGKNGSGKSTILKIIAGITKPSMGSIEIEGRVSSLIELGAGFHPDLTGRENIMMNASILGLSRKFIAERFDEIVQFSELEKFIDVPVKRYSSGMYARLGFSVAASVEPDIFIVDEALSVGDMFFQAKCMSRIKEMRKKGTTLLFVSHDIGAVKTLCRRAILLDHGKVLSDGLAADVAERYFSMKVQSEQKVLKEYGSAAPQTAGGVSKKNPMSGPLAEAFRDAAAFEERAAFKRIQNGQAAFISVQLLDIEGNRLESVAFGQDVTLRMAIAVHDDLDVLSYGYHIRDKNGLDVIYSSAGIESQRLRGVKKGEHYIVDWKFKMSLMHGSYTVVTVISIPVDDDSSKVSFCDFVPIAVQFTVEQRRPIQLFGLVHWANTIEVQKISES
jgi:lipopolysaccharide transport system ATP-binding protein